MNRPGMVRRGVHESLYCCTEKKRKKQNEAKWNSRKEKYHEPFPGTGRPTWTCGPAIDNEKGMGWPTLDSGNFSSSARRCHNLSSRKGKRKTKEKPRQRESYSSSSYVSYYLRGVFDLWYENVSLKDSRARWCDGPADSSDRVWHTRRNGVGIPIPGALLSLSPFSLTISTNGNHHAPSRDLSSLLSRY